MTRKTITIAMAFALALSCAGARSADSPKVIAVVVSKNAPIEKLSMKELQDIFLKRRTRIAGAELEPINRESDSDMRLAFDRAALGMTSDEVKKYWISMRIKGEGGPPKALSSSLAAKRMAAKMDGKSVAAYGIAYIDISEMDDTVKALSIDGHKPPSSADSKSGYPLIAK